MKIIIIGCGRVGAKLARTLSLKGNQITVVDNDPTAFERLGKGFTGRTVLGVGFDREVLINSGIERADGLAAVMESDEANLVAARIATQIFRVPRVVARVYEPRKAEIYSRLGIQTLSPVSIGAEYFADMLSNTPLETIARLGTGNVKLVNVEIPYRLAGRKVNEMNVPGEVSVVAVTRKGKTFLSTSHTEFAEGDVVQVAVANNSLEKFKGMLKV